MNMRTYAVFSTLLLLGAAASGRARAECSVELEVAGTKSDTIRIYKEGGKQDGTIDKALALKQKVLDCDESLGLVKVELTNHRIVWINRSDAKRVEGASASSDVCVKKAIAKDSDHVAAVTAGAESSQHCTPQAP